MSDKVCNWVPKQQMGLWNSERSVMVLMRYCLASKSYGIVVSTETKKEKNKDRESGKG